MTIEQMLEACESVLFFHGRWHARLKGGSYRDPKGYATVQEALRAAHGLDTEDDDLFGDDPPADNSDLF